jgi:hypothetical protein
MLGGGNGVGQREALEVCAEGRNEGWQETEPMRREKVQEDAFAWDTLRKSVTEMGLGELKFLRSP